MLKLFEVLLRNFKKCNWCLYVATLRSEPFSILLIIQLNFFKLARRPQVSWQALFFLEELQMKHLHTS
jgi:hypothetical protein